MFARLASLLLLLILGIATPAFAWPSAKELTLQRLRTQTDVNFVKAPFDKVLQTLADGANVEIVCRPKSLRSENVASDSPITLNLATPISTKSALDLIVPQLRLTYEVRDDGRIEILALPDVEAVERMYDISRLLIGRANLAARAELKAQGGDETLTFTGLVELLKDTVHPESWEYEGRSLIAAENDPYTLVICQSEEVHQAIEDLLSQLYSLTRLRVLTTIEERSVDQSVLETFAREHKLALPLVKLSEEQAAAFNKLLSKDFKRRHYVSYNGEVFTTTERLEVQVSILRDDHTIRLERVNAEELKGAAVVDEIQSGEMLLLDKTDEGTAKAGVRSFQTITAKVMRFSGDDNMRYDRVPKSTPFTWGLQLEE